MDCTWAGCVRERLPIGKQLPFLLRPQSPRPLGMQPVINSHASGIFVRGECWYHEQEICFALLREAVIFKDRPCPLYRHPTIHPVRVSPWFLKDLCFFSPPPSPAFWIPFSAAVTVTRLFATLHDPSLQLCCPTSSQAELPDPPLSLPRRSASSEFPPPRCLMSLEKFWTSCHGFTLTDYFSFTEMGRRQ